MIKRLLCAVLDSNPNGKLKALQNALDYLIGCRPVLNSIAERLKTDEMQISNEKILGSGKNSLVKVLKELKLSTLHYYKNLIIA